MNADDSRVQPEHGHRVALATLMHIALGDTPPDSVEGDMLREVVLSPEGRVVLDPEVARAMHTLSTLSYLFASALDPAVRADARREIERSFVDQQIRHLDVDMEG